MCYHLPTSVISGNSAYLPNPSKHLLFKSSRSPKHKASSVIRHVLLDVNGGEDYENNSPLLKDRERNR